MKILNIFKNKKVPTKVLTKKLIDEINEVDIERLCYHFLVDKTYFSDFFCNLLIKNPDFINELTNNFISRELLDKINNQTYQIEDITYDDKWLFNYLPFDGLEKQIGLKLNQDVNLKPTTYGLVSCNSLDSLDNLKVEKENKIKTYFKNVEINTTERVIKLQKSSFLTDDKIKIFFPINQADVCEINFDLFYKGDLVLNQDTIICLKYEDFIKLTRDDSFFYKISSCSIVIEDYQAIFPLENSLLKPSLKKDFEIDRIKISNLLTIIEKCFSSIDRDYYVYQAKKIYNDLISEDSFLSFQARFDLEQLVKKIELKVGQEKILELTKNFDLKKDIKTDMTFKWNEAVFIGQFSDFSKVSLETILEKMKDLDNDKLNILLSNNQIIAKLKPILNDETDLPTKINIIKREIFLLQYSFNDDIVKFIKKFNVDVETILTLKEANILKPEDINPILSKYRVLKEEENVDINIGDILGYEGYLSSNKRNILLSMDNYFDGHGDGYHSRSVGLLDYDSNEIVDKLKSSFRSEPISVIEIEDNKYFISTNGLHRYTVLRFHYLLDYLKNEANLKTKYKIPVSLARIDYFKSYVKFLLLNLDADIDYIFTHYDENFKYTNKLKIILNNKEKYIVDDNELKNLVLSKVDNIDDDFLKEIINYYQIYPSFKRFIDDNFIPIKEKIESGLYVRSY